MAISPQENSTAKGYDMVRGAGAVRAAGVAAMLVLAAVTAGCGGSGGDSPAAGDTSTTSTAAVAPLRVVVTNDDGIGSPGLDQLVAAIAALPDVEVEVVAPAENQSGSSDRTTEGGVPFAAAATASGVEGTAVSGFPADSVLVAIEELGLEPDVVVSGVNEGQNVGPFAALSGTVGAARTAARLGVPAVAASAGLDYDAAQVAVAVDLVVAWLEENRAALVAGDLPAEVVSFNVPSCDPASMGELVEVPLGAAIPEGQNIFESTCAASTVPVDDVSAMIEGFPTQTRVPIELAVPAG